MNMLNESGCMAIGLAHKHTGEIAKWLMAFKWEHPLTRLDLLLSSNFYLSLPSSVWVCLLQQWRQFLHTSSSTPFQYSYLSFLFFFFSATKFCNSGSISMWIFENRVTSRYWIILYIVYTQIAVNMQFLSPSTCIRVQCTCYMHTYSYMCTLKCLPIILKCISFAISARTCMCACTYEKSTAKKVKVFSFGICCVCVWACD